MRRRKNNLKPRSQEKRKDRSIPTKREQEIERISQGYIFDEIDSLIEAEEEALKAKELAEAEEREEERRRLMASVVDYKHNLYFEANKEVKTRAYLVTVEGHPEYMYISFARDRNKAESDALHYIRDRFYPLEKISRCSITFQDLKGKRAPEFDKFKASGKIPISALMKSGINFSCSCCGNYLFNYDSLKTKQCFIIEGEGEINPFTQGIVVCYSCYKKYFCV